MIYFSYREWLNSIVQSSCCESFMNGNKELILYAFGRMDDDYGESYIDLEDDKEFSFSDTDSIDDCGNVEHKNVDVHSEEHEGADDQNEPTKHADADVASDVYTNILELTEAGIWGMEFSSEKDAYDFYYLWLKDAQSSFIASTEIEEMDSDMMMLTRLGVLSACCNRLCHDVARKQEHFTFIRDEILMLHDKLKKLGNVNTTHNGYGDDVYDPNVVKTKGAPAKKRYDRKSRKCSNCRNTGHTYRTCPLLLCEDDDVSINDDSSSLDSLGTRRQEKGKQTVNHRSTHEKAMKAECLTQISVDNSQGMPMPPIYGVAPSYPPLTQVQFPTQMPTYFGGMLMDNTRGGTWVDMLQNVNKNVCGSSENRSPPQNKKISGTVLGVGTTMWVLFELLEYHLLILVCHLLIFALVALFLWSNASAFMNKSQPKIPQVHIPQELVLQFASALRIEINQAFAVLRDIASGRDLKKFLSVC
ncbi:hypothetical protein RIF29_38783 [Crotalaria pallida]|uniref:Reticulon-like protein n=1 Tax=Crotalaria pallida TaxID=3830 RepID=A0AAN9E2Z9_CROPI